MGRHVAGSPDAVNGSKSVKNRRNLFLISCHDYYARLHCHLQFISSSPISWGNLLAKAESSFMSRNFHNWPVEYCAFLNSCGSILWIPPPILTSEFWMERFNLQGQDSLPQIRPLTINIVSLLNANNAFSSREMGKMSAEVPYMQHSDRWTGMFLAETLPNRMK